MLSSIKNFLIGSGRVLLEGVAPATGSVLTALFTVNVLITPVDPTLALCGLVGAAALGVAQGITTIRRYLNETRANARAYEYRDRLSLALRAQDKTISSLKIQNLKMEQALIHSETSNVRDLRFGGKLYNRNTLEAKLLNFYGKINSLIEPELNPGEETHPICMHKINYFFHAFTDFVGGAGILLFPAMAYQILIGNIDVMTRIGLGAGSVVMGMITVVTMESLLYDNNVTLEKLEGEISTSKQQFTDNQAKIDQLRSTHLLSCRQLVQAYPNLKTVTTLQVPIALHIVDRPDTDHDPLLQRASRQSSHSRSSVSSTGSLHPHASPHTYGSING